MGVYIPNVKRPHSCRMCPNPVCIPDWIHNTMDALDFVMLRRHEHPDSRADGCPIEEIDLVRCGECKHYMDNNICPLSWECFDGNDFCSHGERRTDEDI